MEFPKHSAKIGRTVSVIQTDVDEPLVSSQLNVHSALIHLQAHDKLIHALARHRLERSAKVEFGKMEMRRNIPNGKVLVEVLQYIIDDLIHDLPVQAFLLMEMELFFLF